MEDEILNKHPQLPLIETFIEITNCQSKSESLFFLESHNFDLDAAVSTFLDNDDVVQNPNPNPNPNQNQLSESDHEHSSPSTYRSRSPSPQRLTTRSAGGRTRGIGGGRTRGRGGIRTFADLNEDNEKEEDEDSDDSDFDPQEYYTGGEKSGMLIQDPTRRNPTRRNPSRRNDVNAIFDQARRSGAVGEPEEHHMPSSSRNFSGTGRLLSGDVSSTPQPNEAVNLNHDIVFWRNGFTVDDGPLRRLDDPENASFLESVKHGECPVELAPVNKLAPVHVNLTRREENYQEADRPRLPFQGVGKTLGSTSDVTSTVPTDTTSSVVPTGTTTTVPTSSQGLVIDESQPSTTIQLRLADGTRLVSRFNNYHTIRDIRGFIDVSRGSSTRSYQLQAMGFPPKQLVDLDQTIDEAGIASSVVIQKF